MRRVFAVGLAVLMLAWPVRTPSQAPAQTTEDEGAKNARQARAVLDAMVQALGGDAWLNMKNVERQGQVAAFFHGRPDLGTTEYFEFHQWPDHDRIEYTKHRSFTWGVRPRKSPTRARLRCRRTWWTIF